MRRHQAMVDLVRDMYEQGKIVAMIRHAGWVAVSAGILDGKKTTTTASIHDDMINAGTEWVDEEVV